MTLAQLFIFLLYVLYGSFIYAFQGQFTLPLAYQGVSKFSWQTVGNVLSLFSITIATGLYGNIGTKVVYRSFVEDYFKGPKLMTPKGRIIWSGLVCLYWAFAFVIGSAIPQVQTIVGLIAALAIMQLHTLSPLSFVLATTSSPTRWLPTDHLSPGKAPLGGWIIGTSGQGGSGVYSAEGGILSCSTCFWPSEGSPWHVSECGVQGSRSRQYSLSVAQRLHLVARRPYNWGEEVETTECYK